MADLENQNLDNIKPFASIQEAVDYSLYIFKEVIKTETGYDVDYTTVQGKIIQGFATVVGQQVFLMQDFLDKKVLQQIFPLTANYYYLKYFWGEIFKIYPIEQTNSTGQIIVQGTETKVVPANTTFYTGSYNFTTTEDKTIEAVVIPYTAIDTSISGKIRVTLNQDYNLASGMNMASIDGGYIASDLTITVLSTNQIEFDEVDGVSKTAETGNCNFVMARPTVNSADGGSDYNQINGTELTISSSVTDINDTAFVSYDGITGGLDDEEMEDFRDRILLFFRNISQGWTASHIETLIRTYNSNQYFNAKIWIPRAKNTTGNTAASYTTIYIIKEDLSQLSTTEKTNLKAYLMAIYPIKDTDATFNIATVAFQTVAISITLDSDYNTVDMKNAIEDEMLNNVQYNDDYCFFAQTIYPEDINGRLRNLQDINGISLGDNYTLDTPSASTAVDYNKFPLLTVTIS